MARRIWFNTEKAKFPPYFSIRWGLGQFDEASAKIEGDRYGYCPKLFTTRTHPLHGEYKVVEGSRFKAKPVEPEIRFVVRNHFKFFLGEEITKIDSWNIPENLSNLTFAEMDLGIKGATFEQLRDVLLRLNKGATLYTPFFINRLDPLTSVRPQAIL